MEKAMPMTGAIARPQTSMGRPGTAAARPAPPKLKRKQIATVEETSAAPVLPAAELITETAPPAPEETFLVEEEEVEEVVPDTFKATEAAPAEALLNSLQMVTRTTHPLSRIFDFAQEDLELMIKELEKWRNETKKYEVALKDKEAQGIGDTQNSFLFSYSRAAP
ncbi:hypothetical protein ANCCEY_13864 [Ancylostoma ceylanicum]|uniref:TRAF3-interacting protein 1 C-terminal domain-containing protein n=1 Tax=Ancylostoma ceylanicum TaxID=53326 RepID=A0A0D6LB65_9BILA|nr:hypothetical protein ANCCEY_13864 [Ancylostoma ceylanicum]